MNQEQLKVLAIELAAAMPPLPPRHIDPNDVGICPMIGQLKALLESALNDLNSLDSKTPDDERRRVFNRATWLVDAGITITHRMGVEAGNW